MRVGSRSAHEASDPSLVTDHRHPSLVQHGVHPMIGYVTLGTNDMQRAIRFYEQLLTLFEVKRGFDTDRFVLWYPSKPGRPGLGVIKPHDGKAASVSNGGMVALGVDTPAKVDEVHRKARGVGGQDEGAPG